jgi:[DsrC]-trisulfide reductase subunit O
MDRRDLLKLAGGSALAGVSGAYAVYALAGPSLAAAVYELAGPLAASGSDTQDVPRWGMLIDLDKCNACGSGCTACMDACHRQNNVLSDHDDPGYDNHWIRKVKVKRKKTIGHTNNKKSVILLCNHCDNPPCAQVCPVQATYKRHDGIVIVDHHRCIGCRYCMIACPYNARMFTFKDIHDDKDTPDVHEGWPNKDRPKRSHGVAEACNLCAHRLDAVDADGNPAPKLPACVEACQKKNSGDGALIVGNLNDSESEISKKIAENPVKRIRDDLGTEPKVYYIGL